MTPEQLFADLLATEPARPFVTSYDESTGERAELSAKSLSNWVVKTYHLLTAELGLGVGDGALLALPAHWLTPAPLLGVLCAGLSLTTDPAAAEVAFVVPGTLATADGVPEVYALDVAAAAVGLGADAPDGAVDSVRDYVSAVRPHEDKWPSVHLAGADDDPCLPGLTRAEVVERARARAAELGLEPGARLLTTRDWTGPEDWIDTLLAPLAVRGSVVYVRNCLSEQVLARRLSQERATLLP